MRTHLVVGGQNLTGYIVDGSYDVNASDIYESWLDGNYVEHRVIITKKVTGKFKIGCADQRITLSDLLEIWTNATDNGVIPIGIYVPNLDEFKAIDAYYTIESDHIVTAEGRLIDVLNVSISER